MKKQRTPLMPKATSLWLVDNTALTFQQIADFCNMHILEIQAIADGNVSGGILPQSPIKSGQLSVANIEECERNHDLNLTIEEDSSDGVYVKKSGTKYIPIARRRDKPDAILYIIKNYSDIEKSKIKKLIGTTTKMIESIDNKTYWNYKELKPRDPVLLGLCSQSDFNKLIES